MVEKFEFTDKLKKNLYYLVGAGVLGLILAFVLYPENHHSRFWTNVLLNAYYFVGIGIFGIFFASANQLGYGGWITLIKRIFMSLSGFIKVGAVFALIIVGGVWGHYHNLYAWADPSYMKELANTKQTFFNSGFWTGRVILYFLLWIFVGAAVIKAINAKNINEPKVYKRSKLMAALWIVIFAVTESFVSWDLVMGTDAHWYSTLFGWYNFASYGCAAFAFTILLIIYLKSQGLLKQVNENHLHDVGKMMFGFSILWTYLWFDQFMLQWYGNIPEDTKYWIKRFDIPLFKFTIFFALALNFLAPLLLFIKRDAKRSYKTAAFIAVLVIIGHWFDFFNMTMYEPNNAIKKETAAEAKKEAAAKVAAVFYAQNKAEEKAVVKDEKAGTDATTEKAEVKTEAKGEAVKSEGKEGVKESGKHEGVEPVDAQEPTKTYAGLGIVEILIFAGFLGGFLLMFFTEFSKDSTFNENDPYLKESINLHVEYA
jgi:hypothetical protein